MHIPEGYLGPQTYGAAYAVMLPIWATAGRVVQRSLSARKVPLLAIGAAFSFVVMMFNVPIPGGTTGHATGGALLAILLGPWAAVITLSVVLAVQAFVFQDGGITALGANCFNMAFVLPFTAYGVYRLLSIRAAARSTRRVVAAGIAGYVGLNAAALTAAVMLGIQPMIAHAADGRPLYSPFGLGVAVPVMAAGHLLVFGFVEGIITALAFSYLAASDPGLVAPAALPGRPRYRRLAWGLAILALLTPLGIWLPRRLGASGAWGEWGPAELVKKVGFMPQYLDRLSHLWKAPIPDYAPRGWAARPFTYQGLAYVLSALIGIAVCAALLMILSRWLVRTSRMGHDSGVPPPGAGRGPDAEITRGLLPDWVSLPTSPRAGRDRGRSRFVDRSLRESARVLQDSVFAERVARSPGFLQSLDARVKLVSLLALLIAATFLHHLVSLWLFGVCVAAMAALSRVRRARSLQPCLVALAGNVRDRRPPGRAECDHARGLAGRSAPLVAEHDEGPASSCRAFHHAPGAGGSRHGGHARLPRCAARGDTRSHHAVAGSAARDLHGSHRSLRADPGDDASLSLRAAEDVR